MKLSDLFHQHKDLGRILQKSDRVDVNNARNSGGPQGYVRIYSVKKLKNGGFLFVTITREPYKRPRKHLVKIWPKDPNYRGKLSDCPDVLVRCDCARFMFKWEVANNIHGISPIHYSNGEFPSETNPRAKMSGCIAQGTKIATNNGLKNIEDITYGDEVWTYKGYRKVLDKIDKGFRKTVILETSAGNLEATPDHKVLVANETGIHYKKVQDLTDNDYLVYDISDKNIVEQYQKLPFVKIDKIVDNNFSNYHSLYHIRKQPKILDEDLAFLMGAYYGDGHSTGIAGQKNHKGMVTKKCKNIVKKLFGVDGWYKDKYIAIFGKEVSQYLRYFLGKGYTNKKIPDIILQSPKSVMCSFLNGLFSTDGCINKYDIRCFTTSEETRKVQIMLNYLGINSTLSVYRLRSGKDFYNIRIAGDSKDRFFELVNPERYIEKVYQKKEYKPKGIANQGVYFCPKIDSSYLKEKMMEADIERLKSQFTEWIKVKDFATQLGLSIDYCTSNARKYLQYELRKCPGVDRPTTFAKSLDLLNLTKDKILNKGNFGLALPGTKCNTNKLSTSKILETLEQFGKKIPTNIKQLMNKKFVFIKVKRKQKSQAQVWDLSVKGIPQFCANGFLVHNCKHIVRCGKAILNHGW